MRQRDTERRVATLGKLLDLYESVRDDAKRSPLAKQAASLFFSLWSNEGSVLHRPDLADLYLRAWRVLPREALMRWQPDAYPITVYRAATVRDADGWCWTPDIIAYLLAWLHPHLPENVRRDYSDDQIFHTFRYIADMGHGRIFRRQLNESDVVATHEVRTGGFAVQEVIAYPTGKMPEALAASRPLQDESAWAVPVGHLRIGAKAWGPHATTPA